MVLPCKITRTTEKLLIYAYTFLIKLPRRERRKALWIASAIERHFGSQTSHSSWAAAGGFEMLSLVERMGQMASVPEVCMCPHGVPLLQLSC